MIAWWVGVLLFFLGNMMGIIAMAILYGSWSHKEEREKQFLISQGLIYPDSITLEEAKKMNRQRGNADGSGERSSRE